MELIHKQSGHEVFQRANMSLSMPGVSKQRRKSFFGKSKSLSISKAKTRTVLGELQGKENLENRSSGKGKSSKKVLSVKVSQPVTLNSDLKRVLGHSAKKTSSTQRKAKESTSSSESVPLTEISTRLSKGLATDALFPGSCYLQTTKAEICKTMKQSNPDIYEELKTCFIGPREECRTFYCGLIEGPVSLQPPTTIQQVLCDSVEVSNEVDMIDSLNLETTSNGSQSSPLNLKHGNSHSDLLDLMESSELAVEHAWKASPVKRPKLFPQKLY